MNVLNWDVKFGLPLSNNCDDYAEETNANIPNKSQKTEEEHGSVYLHQVIC